MTVPLFVLQMRLGSIVVKSTVLRRLSSCTQASKDRKGIICYAIEMFV